MRRGVAVLVGLVAFLALVGVAQAAKTYNDPWLEGDLQQIRVPGALDILARTPRHVIVGDIDSGAALNDPDLGPHLVRMSMPYACASAYGPGSSYAADPANGDFGCDFIGGGEEAPESTIPDGEPADSYGHGTGTAAIIAAVQNNGIGGAGVAPNARVLPVRACYGGNPDCFEAPTVDGFEYAVAMGATIINASWPPSNEFGSTFRNFIHGHPEVLFDFAIGGSDQNDEPFTLCTQKTTFPNVICVGAANPDDTPGTVNANLTTDVSAPGYAGVPSVTGTRTEFGSTGGPTSAATAHVTGAAALLRGLAPGLTAAQIRQALVSTTRTVAGYQTANQANGIIDVEAAVRAVQQMEGLAIPAPGHGSPADSPDPFAGQAAAGESTPGTAPTATPPAPAAPHGGSTSTATRLSLLGKLPSTVAAGASLKLHLLVSGGTANLAASLTHGKTTLVKATRHAVSGKVTLKLRLPRGAKLGPAKLSLKLAGASPLVKKITVTKPR